MTNIYVNKLKVISQHKLRLAAVDLGVAFVADSDIPRAQELFVLFVT